MCSSQLKAGSNAMSYTRLMKKICSKLEEMEQQKVNRLMSGKSKLVAKLLGTGESRVMFR